MYHIVYYIYYIIRCTARRLATNAVELQAVLLQRLVTLICNGNSVI